MSKSKILFGVHNDHYNIDFYDNNSIDIYDHIACELITTFDEELVALFVSFLKRDGHLDRLLEIEEKRFREMIGKTVLM